MRRTHYEVLGVLRTSSEQDIKRAFRQLARAKHPDVGGDQIHEFPDFARVSAAAEVLLDPRRRREYDDELAREAWKTASRVRRPARASYTRQRESEPQSVPSIFEPLHAFGAAPPMPVPGIPTRAEIEAAIERAHFGPRVPDFVADLGLATPILPFQFELDGRHRLMSGTQVFGSVTRQSRAHTLISVQGYEMAVVAFDEPASTVRVHSRATDTVYTAAPHSKKNGAFLVSHDEAGTRAPLVTARAGLLVDSIRVFPANVRDRDWIMGSQINVTRARTGLRSKGPWYFEVARPAMGRPPLDSPKATDRLSLGSHHGASVAKAPAAARGDLSEQIVSMWLHEARAYDARRERGTMCPSVVLALLALGCIG